MSSFMGLLSQIDSSGASLDLHWAWSYYQMAHATALYLKTYLGTNTVSSVANSIALGLGAWKRAQLLLH